MGDVRAHGAIYTNTLLHVCLAKYPACRAALDLQPTRHGHSASTRATCPKFLAWCAAQLRCTTASQETCGIGWARPPASRKGTHTLRHSSPGARAHTAPNEREPQMMMIAFITFKSSLVPLFEGLWSSNSWDFEVSGFRRNRTDDLGIDSPSLWPTEPTHGNFRNAC